MSYSVGLNAHLLSLTRTYRSAGINGYIYQLLRHLPVASTYPEDGSIVPGGHLNLRYTAYLYVPAFVAPPDMAVCRSRWDTRQPWRRIAWEQTRLALYSRCHDLLHGLAFASPLVAACPTVVTVHDLSFMRFPEMFRPVNRLYLTWITRTSVRRAARVIAVSESTRQDVIRLCGVPGERVTVVYNGVTEAFCPASPTEAAAFRQRKGLPERFIFFLGTLEPRKNLVRLIEAYAEWRRASGEPVKLVLAGAKGWYYHQIFARVDQLGLVDDVIFPDFVPDDELPWWYRAAELFVYPSLFEGFGLPVLEALACGTPVITSTASSLPEVAGCAVLLVNAEETAALATAIGRVMADRSLAATLREAGPRQAAQFSWARAAAATADVYCAVLEGRSPGGPA